LSDRAQDRKIDVAVFFGSLRRASFSRKVAHALIDLTKRQDSIATRAL
jgi:NAD(P)H-dependent FMN reductase